MPLYEYQDKDSGEIVERFAPRPLSLRERYNCPPHLMPVISLPGRPRIGRAGLRDPAHAEESIPRAFKECEQKIGTSETCRLSGFTAKQIRKAWNF
jgi:hypothetical protein